MNKKEFIASVSEMTGDSLKKTREALEAMQEVIFTEIAKGEEVKLFDGVTFLSREVPERMRRNPATGENVLCPKHNKPAVKFGKPAKDAVNA